MGSLESGAVDVGGLRERRAEVRFHGLVFGLRPVVVPRPDVIFFEATLDLPSEGVARRRSLVVVVQHETIKNDLILT